jgi:hypothetical protein
MVGLSEGRTYKGQARSGVTMFDFKLGRVRSKNEQSNNSVFVGYGSIPGLRPQ